MAAQNPCCCMQVFRIINIVLFWPVLTRTGSGINLRSAAATAWSSITACITSLRFSKSYVQNPCCCTQVVRVINIILFWPILARTGCGMDFRSAAATAWSGIRGFVGLILALMVSVDPDIQDEPYKLLCLFFMATTACLTIVVQGGFFELVLWVSCCCASGNHSLFDHHCSGWSLSECLLLCFFLIASTTCFTIVVQDGVFESVLWVSCKADDMCCLDNCQS